MLASTPTTVRSPLLQLIENRVRLTTNNRVRDLRVEEIDGRVVVQGVVPSRHTKQLALHAALEFVSGHELCERLTVG